jgi:CHAP domain
VNTTAVPRVGRISLLFALLFALLTAGLVTVGAKPAQADVSAPSWWSGDCDVNNHSGSSALGAFYNGVKACGPGPTQGGTDHLVHFTDSNGNQVGAGEYEWECVELVMRYMYQVYGIPPYVLTGGHAYNVVNSYGGTDLNKVTNNGVSTPTPGDILAFAASANHPTDGHTAVVTAVSVDGNGNGTVTYMQQNVPNNNGWGSVSVSGRVLDDNISGWLHNPNYTAPSTIKSLVFSVTSDGTYHVFDGVDTGPVHETYWTPGNSPTTYQVVYDGATSVNSVAFTVTSDGVYHIFSGTSVGKLYETYWTPGTPPTTYQVVNEGSAVNSLAFAVTGTTYHVFSGLADGTIHETYWTPGNAPTDSTLKSFGSAVNSIAFTLTGTTYHVFSGLANGTIHETYWVPGSVPPTDSTLCTFGSTVSRISFGLTSDGVYHVFSGIGAKIYETYWVPGSVPPSTYQLTSVG